jgi:hypothetical protein
MSKPQVVALALVALAAAAPAAEAQFAYQPITQRYRLEQVMEGTQEMGGQKQTNTATTTQLLGLQVAKAADGLTFTFTVDSVGIQTPVAQAQAQAQAEANKLVGKQVTGTLSPLGQVVTIQGPAGDANGEQLAAGFRNFFPRFPNGALKSGMTWTDTTSAKFNNNGIEGTSTTIVTYTVEGDTTVEGRSGWRVSQKGSVNTSGMGNANGQELALSGDGTMTGVAVVSKDGHYLGSDSRLQQNMTVQVVAMNMQVPITQTITSKIRMVP